jgi:hypothetical protein
MDIKQFIQQVSEGNAVQAKETLDNILSSRAFEALDAKKVEIAQSLYNNEEVEVQNTADTPMEDELLTQEEFDALSEEDQELYLEAIEELDELSKDTYKNYLLQTRSLQKKHHAGSQLSRYGEIGPKDRDLNTELGRAHAKKQLKKEEVEELDEVSQKTAIKAFVARAGREGDDDSKSTKTMDRIFKKHGQKGVVKAANALDKDQRPFSSDYTKKDYVSGVLAKHGAGQNYDSRNKPDPKPSKGPVKGRGYA